MTKLDEIEARAEQSTVSGRTMVSAVDVRILIRAVRQLGDVYKSTFPQRELDPDVLELLEEGE